VVVVAQAFFGFSTWLAAVSISRRPDVERNGQIVDGMWTVCAFDRYVTCRLDESKIADGYSDTLSDGEDDFSTRHDIHRHFPYHPVDFRLGSRITDQLRRHSCPRCFHACRKPAYSIPCSSQEQPGTASFLDTFPGESQYVPPALGHHSTGKFCKFCATAMYVSHIDRAGAT